MWIRDVDFPADLVGAHRAGELVIFVGAGASVAPPSDLPTFGRLTDDIASESGIERRGEPEDRFLGVLKDRHDVDVHARVAAKIGKGSSRPNKLHEAVIALATSGPVARIVTTNYDTHLSTVLDSIGLRLPEYLAPALPMGDDFDGLVYLHGKLGQRPSRLVVTDEDFGRAYLRDTWATRFLERMFAKYRVLFIGYSHADVVMTYLGRGLRDDNVRRYTLTHVPDGPQWRSLRITPVAYQKVDGSHHRLDEALDRWASLSSMGLLEHRQQIADLMTAEPSGIPEEDSYLEEVVADSSRVSFLAEFARGPAWLTWAEKQPGFRRLFEPGAAPTDPAAADCTAALAGWFARYYVMDPELSDDATGVVLRAGGRLSPELWSAIGWGLQQIEGPRPPWLAPWLVLLVENTPEQSLHLLEFALAKARWPEDRAAALLLLDHLTEPRVLWERSLVPGRGMRAEFRLRGDDHRLREGWTTVFGPHLAEAAADVLPVAERQLRRMYQLQRTAASADARWDPLSHSRSTIAPHEQNRLARSADILIDISRDCLESELDRDTAEGAARLELWANSEMPLLRRLAVHGWTHRRDVGSTAKLTWLLDRDWLFDVRLRPEVFQLIETTLSRAEPSVAERLVDRVLAGPQPADEHRDYEIFNALVWLTRCAPDLARAGEALSRMREAHPNWEAREHPDLTRTFESGFIASKPPMSTDALHELIEKGPAGAISELRRFEQTPRSFDRPTWQDAIDVLTSTVGRWPADGFAVLDAAGGDHPGIVHGVIRGWSTASLEPEMAASIADRLGRLDLDAVASDVARLFEEGGRTEGSPTEWHRVPAARRLAEIIWTSLPGEPVDEPVDDWLTWAINQPAGMLAEFWIHAVATDWREAGESWQGLPPELRRPLETMLDGDDARTAAAQVVLVTSIHFFFAADPDWARAQLMPLLDWTSPVRALRAWDGFLFGGRPNDPLLHAGLLDLYLEAATHAGELRDGIRRQLFEHLAVVALRSEIDPAAKRWPWTLTSDVDPQFRAGWMERVGWLLSELPGEAVQHEWQRWMRSYWQDRVDSVPTQLTMAEASAMAEWLVHLPEPESIREGVEFATRCPAALGEHSSVLDDLDDRQFDREPAAYATLLTHLLRNTEPPFYGCYPVPALVAKVRELAGPTAATAIIEQAVRLGCPGAADW